MAFGDYVRVLRTYWRSILAVTVLGIAVGGVLTFAITPQYTATAQVLFTATMNADDTGQDIAYGSTYTQSRMVNYQSLVTSDRVLAPVVSSASDDNSVGLDLDLTPKQLREKVSADFAPTSTVLNVNVEDESAEEAVRLATAIADSLDIQVRIDELEKQPEDGTVAPPRSRVEASVITEPTEPGSPSSPKLQLYLVGGALLGLLLALAVALIRNARAGRPPKAPKQPKVKKNAVTAPTVVPPAPPAPPAAIVPPTPPVPPAPVAPATPAVPQNTKRSGKRTRR